MNTLFKKQFCMHAFALIISFVLLGAGLTKAFTSFFINQKQEMLIEHNKKIAKDFKQAYFFGNTYRTKDLKDELKILEEYLNASFIFLDNENIIKVLSNSIDSKWYNTKIDIKKYLDDYKDGMYYQIHGTMGGIFNEPVLSIGYPLVINGIEIGTIFMNTPVTDLLIPVEKAYQIIIIFIIVAIIVAFILVYFFSKKISLPLIEINKAAKVMANGNFEKRICINSKDEIGQLADILNEMAQSLYEQEKRRNELISNISHDIRSPLTSMKGFLQALIDGTIQEDKRERYLNIVIEETERITRLANNILDINNTKTDTNEINYVKFDINELIRRVIISFESRIISKELNTSLSFDEEETFVLADFEKIQRVIYNLVDNAIKFTENKKNIFISTKVKGNKVYVSIKDEGCGISIEEQRRVFDRFYKVDSSRGQDKNGSGLGLSIVKEFIISQGETIEINSGINKGSEFIFTLTKFN